MSSWVVTERMRLQMWSAEMNFLWWVPVFRPETRALRTGVICARRLDGSGSGYSPVPVKKYWEVMDLAVEDAAWCSCWATEICRALKTTGIICIFKTSAVMAQIALRRLRLVGQWLSDVFQGRSWRVNMVALPWRQKPVWLFTTKQRACDFPRTPRRSAGLHSI